ncbi:hypothetical protein VP01_147g11 [Puccinia sorghi]|uniref:Integrase catalytic domain-containing protein n=1 Tax=Puccinia sorghi TaxID=27349 RepID=A0A0L6VJQ5_9BASI|nr:hypothetical protein VP01_147g11 [Puccinia sorghi]
MAAVVPNPVIVANPNDGFRQAMLKTALETIPQLTEENYSIWKDKITALLKLRGVLKSINDQTVPLGESDNAELTMLLLAKMDSVTHNNVVTADNSESAQKLWASIKDRFASSQSSNRARMFNDFLYVKFQEEAVETFVTDVKVAIKKLVDVGIELPQDILAYLVLFKFPNSLQSLKRQIMHSDKDLNVEFNPPKLRRRQHCLTLRGSLIETKRKNARIMRVTIEDQSVRCWHLHPEIAPEWWKDSQAQWLASKEKKSENYFMSLLTLWIESGDPKSKIILDSGASAHIFNDERFFETLEMGNFDEIKTGKQGATMPIRGKGKVRLVWENNSISLDNCLFVPDIVINLISAGELDSKGCTLLAKNSSFTVTKEGRVAFTGKINNGLFSVKNPKSVGSKTPIVANVLEPKESLREIHEKFGHASIARIDHLLDESISRSERENFECKSCVLAKITRQPFKLQSERANKPFERLHLDLIGPIKPESSLKHRFILTVVDNHSGYLAAFPLTNKDDTTDVLINLIECENKRRGYYPSLVCSDGGGEFIGARLVRFLTEKHIQRLISEPYHPQHNGRAERANRTIVKSVRATINSAGVQKRFWHEVLKSCCLGLNQIPQKGQTQSPWEILHEKKFPTNFLRAVGTPTIILISCGVKGRKFDHKGEEGRLVGFNVALRSYRVVTKHGKVIETKHVRFLKKEETAKSNDSDDFLELPPVEEGNTVNPEDRITSQADKQSSDHREGDHDREDSIDSEEEDVEVENHDQM